MYECEPGRSVVVVKPGGAPRDYSGESGVHYVVREAVCGTHIQVSVVASWRRYKNVFRDPVEEAERTRLRALRRLKERVLTMGADRMITLTYRENLEDFELSREHFRKWVAKMRRSFPAFKFVAAAEQQQRGAYHWHVAVKGFYPVNIVRGHWVSIVGDGNVDITAPRRGGAPKIADYISKYLGKGFDLDGRVRYQHYYSTSRGIASVTYGYHLIGYTSFDLQEFMEGLCEHRGKRVKTRWWKDDHYERGGLRTW